MPTYVYECGECELVFEKFHSMSDTVEKCEKCGSLVRRVVSTTFNVRKNNNFGRKKPGNVVRKYIKDTKDDIQQEKQRLLVKEHEAK